MPLSTLIALIFLSFFCLTFAGCKKDKTQIIEGILLYSQTNPEPVRNYELTLSQSGGNAIIMGTSSSSASGITDNEGRFSIAFTPGKGYFIGIPTQNSSPTSLYGKAANNYPGTYRTVFPDSGYNASRPIYLVKEIQQYIVEINAKRAMIPTDTIIIKVGTKTGEIEKTYTSLSIPAGTTQKIDTIRGVISSWLDVRAGGYKNPFWFPLSNRQRDIYFSHQGHIGRDDEVERICEIVIF